MIKGYGEKINTLYENIRKNNLDKQKKRINKVSKMYPEIINLKRDLSKLYFSILRTKDKDKIKDISLKIKDIRSKIKNILLILNLNENYLDTIYTCDKCNDTGYINTKKCDCFYKNLSLLYLEDSELKSYIKTNNFDNFDFSYFSQDKITGRQISYNTNIKNLYNSSLQYIKNFKNINDNLLFIGGCGSGKTFLSHCIAKDLLDKGYSVLYKTSNEFFNKLSKYYSGRDYYYKNLNIGESLLMKCDLLIIDDLGTEPNTDVNNSYFFNFLNQKLSMNKKMIISTNFTLKHLGDTYTERISSRLFGNFNIFNFYIDEDIRIQEKRKKKRDV